MDTTLVFTAKLLVLLFLGWAIAFVVGKILETTSRIATSAARVVLVVAAVAVVAVGAPIGLSYLGPAIKLPCYPGVGAILPDVLVSTWNSVCSPQ